MPDYSSFLLVMKQIALDTMEASRPVNICFGEVTCAQPLEIMVDQRLPLGAAQLIVPQHMTDYTIPVSVDWNTDSEDSISGSKELTIHNALKTGESVVLLRMQGGQKYLIIDKVVVV